MPWVRGRPSGPPLPRRRGVAICPEHHGPSGVCAGRRHRQYRPVPWPQDAQEAPAAPTLPDGPDPAAQASPGPSQRRADERPVNHGQRFDIVDNLIVDNLIVDNLMVGGALYATLSTGATVNTASLTALHLVGMHVWSGTWGGSTTTYASTTGNWTIFVGSTAAPPYDDPIQYGHPEPRRDFATLETDEERDARLTREQEARERAERERAERYARERAVREARAAADARARELLLSLLDDDQRREFENRATVTVVGSAGNRFRLDTSTCEGNIAWLDEHDRERGRMCVHPVRYHPEGVLPLLDAIAGQVLALRTDERALVAVANPYGGRMPTYPAEPDPEVTEAEMTDGHWPERPHRRAMFVAA